MTEARVLVVHDWIPTWAGAERVLTEILCLWPAADLVVGVLAPGVRDLNPVTRRARETWLAAIPGARRHHRWFLPLQAAAFAFLDTRGYDLIISSSGAFAKAVRGSAAHVCYCHSPPRYLWDLAEVYRQSARGLQRAAFAAGNGIMRAVDRWSARRVDHFACNSRYVAGRIQRAYGRAAQVIYPPVDPKPCPPVSPDGREDFLLSLGRLVPYKRVDLAIQAAERLGIRLLIAGEGPERQHLQRLAGPRTQFLGDVSETEAGRLLERCRAFVFCAEEDFGIAPVEANAHGAPVVGFARGGLTESMIPGVTAEFFSEPSVEAVTDAIQRAFRRDWDHDAIRRNAAPYAPQRFRAELRAFVRERTGIDATG